MTLLYSKELEGLIDISDEEIKKEEKQNINKEFYDFKFIISNKVDGNSFIDCHIIKIIRNSNSITYKVFCSQDDCYKFLYFVEKFKDNTFGVDLLKKYEKCYYVSNVKKVSIKESIDKNLYILCLKICL